ncbi:MAG: spore protease YyaC [Lachnospiraceae bacterium]
MKDYYFTMEETPATFADQLFWLTRKKKKPHQLLLFLCIGTDRATGDCLGPLIGYKLEQYHPSNYVVAGSLSNPVHAGNLRQYISSIQNSHLDPFIIAIDACLGTQDHVGMVTLSEHGIYPGQGVRKSLPAIGHLSITGIVNRSPSAGSTPHSSMQTIQNTRLSVVMQLADYITDGISQVFH